MQHELASLASSALHSSAMRKKSAVKKSPAKKKTAKKTVAKRGRPAKAQRKPAVAKPARTVKRAKRTTKPVFVTLTPEQVDALARAFVDEIERRQAAKAEAAV